MWSSKCVKVQHVTCANLQSMSARLATKTLLSLINVQISTSLTNQCLISHAVITENCKLIWKKKTIRLLYQIAKSVGGTNRLKMRKN